MPRIWTVLDLQGVETIRVANDEYGIKNRLLHDEPRGKFLVYRSGPVPTGIGNWLLDLELAYGVFTADRTSLVAQDLGLDRARASARSCRRTRSSSTRPSACRASRHCSTPDDDADKAARQDDAPSLLGQREHSLLEITRTLLIENATGQRAKYDALADYGLDDFYWRGVAVDLRLRVGVAEHR